MIKSITVYCGSSDGGNALYTEEAFALGKYFAQSGIRIVYGGAKIGVMGAVAEGAMQHGGEVIGVIPKFLCAKEIVHFDVTELKVVQTMHERKTLMNDLSDAAIALPGGYGTLEELFEMLTWAQLGLHQKPIGLLNTNNYYNHLIQLRDQMYQEGFIRDIHKQMLIVDNEAEQLLQKMNAYVAPELPKWITDEQT